MSLGDDLVPEEHRLPALGAIVCLRVSILLLGALVVNQLRVERDLCGQDEIRGTSLRVVIAASAVCRVSSVIHRPLGRWLIEC